MQRSSKHQVEQYATASAAREVAIAKEKVEEIVIHEIAIGHEEVYQQFLRGKLVYKPNQNNDVGRKEFRISDLANPLSGTFDIRGCGDSDQYLSISTGFRTGKNPANQNKLEVWIVPQLVLQKDPRAKPYNELLQKQERHLGKPFAVLFTWGGWDDGETAHAVTGVVGNKHDSLARLGALGTAMMAFGSPELLDTGTLGKLPYISE